MITMHIPLIVMAFVFVAVCFAVGMRALRSRARALDARNDPPGVDRQR